MKNKKGSFLPVRTSGRKKKNSILMTAVYIVLGVFIVMGSIGVYNKWIAPAAKLDSSLNDGKGDTNTIDGATGTYPVSDTDLATFTFSIQDVVNDDTDVTAQAIDIGAIDSSGKERLNPTSTESNDTISTIPENTVLSFYGGDTSYYLEPVVNRKIEIGDVISMEARKIQTEANMLVTVYDNTGSTALSAAANTTFADYQLTLGAGQSKSVYIKLTNNAADGDFDIKAIAVGVEGTNMSKMEVVGSDWSELGTLPDMISDATVTYYNNETAVTTGEYDAVYVYKKGTNEVITLNEWDDSPLIKANILAKDSKNPAALAGEVAFFTIFDGAWARGSDKAGHFDFYQHDGAEGNVGLDETENSPVGKQLGAIIEIH